MEDLYYTYNEEAEEKLKRLRKEVKDNRDSYKTAETELMDLSKNQKLLNGVNYLADVVGVTLGAKGKNVLFNNTITFKPQITKDGITAARQVRSDDPYEDMAIHIVREASEKTVKTSGDGTTTTILLARNIVNEGIKALATKMSFYDLSKQLDKAKDEIIEKVKFMSLPIEENFDKLLHVATVSSSDEKIGKFIYDIMEDIGIYGSIEIKESHKSNDKIDKVRGIKVHKGFYAAQFVTDRLSMEYRAKGVNIVLFDDTIRSMKDVMPYIEACDGEPILFFVNDVETTVLHTLINAKVTNPAFNVMIVEHDGFGDRRIEIMNDICAMTGASVADAETMGNIGWAGEVIVNEDTTSLLDLENSMDKDLVNELIEETKYKLENAADDDDAKYQRRRLATLAGGVAVIHVGGATEVEMKEKKDRIEDAVEAVRSAIDRGVTVGGGYTFLEIAKTINAKSEPTTGEFILAKSIVKPFEQLCNNSDVSPSDVSFNMDGTVGYDVIENKLIPLEEYKVYDPAGVLIDAISNAVAVAKSILSIECSIYND
jgi:chaperonin GroEL